MRSPISAAAIVLAGCLAASIATAQDIRLVRSLSGPSGKVQGAKFVFDETRSRFIFPQDKSLVVYFEWDAPPGTHVLTAYWKQPDGRTAAISPDVKIESTTRELKSYWTYLLSDSMASGIWTVEVRIDGQPAGSNSLEIVAPEQPKAPVEAPKPKPPTMDEIFTAATRSMVWVHKLDAAGRRADTALGFVFGQNRIATAFQAVDSTGRLEIEFPDGHKQEAAGLLAYSRTGDWALVVTDTGAIPALTAGDPKSIVVGERLIAFSVEKGARVIGGVDIAGRNTLPGFGERVQILPALSSEAAGGPLLDLWGRVVGIIGGSIAPGARSGNRITTFGAGLWNILNGAGAAIPISAIAEHLPDHPASLTDLMAAGILTPPLVEMPELLFGGTTRTLPKTGTVSPQEINEFSRSDTQIYVYSEWEQKGKLSKGMVSARVYDENNHVRVNLVPHKVTLERAPVRLSFGFTPTGLSAGITRIDLMWDDKPVWRTYVRITE